MSLIWRLLEEAVYKPQSPDARRDIAASLPPAPPAAVGLGTPRAAGDRTWASVRAAKQRYRAADGLSDISGSCGCDCPPSEC